MQQEATSVPVSIICVITIVEVAGRIITRSLLNPITTTPNHVPPSCTETDQIQPFMLTAFLVEASVSEPHTSMKYCVFSLDHTVCSLYCKHTILKLWINTPPCNQRRIVNKDGVHSRTYTFNGYSDGASNRDGRVLICPCHQFINDYTE